MYLFLINVIKNLKNLQNENILVKIDKIEGNKCPRCWKTFKDNFKKELCVRCEKVIDENF